MKNGYRLALLSFGIIQSAIAANEGKGGPVRIPRPVLYQELMGTFRVDSKEFKSALNWIEEPTRLPPPEPGALADYRDFRGCLQYQDVGPVAVCFNVMPDVSSVGVNSREMMLDGVENFLSEELGMNVKDLHFEQAVRKEQAVQMTFSGTSVSERQGQSIEEPVSVDFSIAPL